MTFQRITLSLALAALACAPLSAAPVNPNATPEAKALLQYLVSISGQKILSGQESMFSDGTFPSTRDKYVFEKTGKYPAIYTTDFGDVNTGNLSDRNKVVTNAKAYHAKGSIIAIQYHMIQPNLADGAGFSAMNIKGSTYTQFNEILTEGSALNVEFKKRLDELAGYFKNLETAGIPVLWRPYHEMNGDFFWWSHQEKYKDFWKYTYNYLTTTKQCNNLIWVFGINWYGAGSTGKNAPDYYYPGHEFVDVLSCDFYTEYGHAYDKRIHDALRTLGGGKPIAIAENGTMPDIPALRVDQPYWTYWGTWWGFEKADKGNTDALYTKNYSDPNVITQDEISVTPVDTNLRVVQVSAEGSGTVTSSPSGTSLAKGTSVTFTAAPATGWEFKGWSGSDSSKTNPLTLTVSNNINLVATFAPLPGTMVNQITNGDFSSPTLTGWTLGKYEGATATDQVQNGQYVVTITGAGAELWHVQVIHSPINIVKGKTYTLSFDAFASAPKSIYVKVGQASGDYKMYADMNIELGTAKQTYTKTFTMADTTDPAARLEFNLASNTATTTLDNVSLSEGAGASIHDGAARFGRRGGMDIAYERDGIRFRLPEGSRQVTLASLEGKTLESRSGNEGFIRYGSLPRGTYLLRVAGDQGAWAAKIVLDRM